MKKVRRSAVVPFALVAEHFHFSRVLWGKGGIEPPDMVRMFWGRRGVTLVARASDAAGVAITATVRLPLDLPGFEA